MLLKGQKPSLLEIHILGYDNPGAKRDKWVINLLRVTLFLRDAVGREGRTSTYLLTFEVYRLIDWLSSINRQQVKEAKLSFHYGRVAFEWLKKEANVLIIRVHFDFPAGKQSSLPKEREDPFEWFGTLDLALTPPQLANAIETLTDEIAYFPIRYPTKR